MLGKHIVEIGALLVYHGSVGVCFMLGICGNAINVLPAVS